MTFEFTDDERMEAEEFVKSSAYRKLVDHAIERARNTCEAPSDRILYHQGIIGGVREFCKLLENYALPPVMRIGGTGEAFEHFRSISGRKA